MCVPLRTQLMQIIYSTVRNVPTCPRALFILCIPAACLGAYIIIYRMACTYRARSSKNVSLGQFDECLRRYIYMRLHNRAVCVRLPSIASCAPRVNNLLYYTLQVCNLSAGALSQSHQDPWYIVGSRQRSTAIIEYRQRVNQRRHTHTPTTTKNTQRCILS